MEEIRKNHLLQLKSKGKMTIDGVVMDYTSDRIMVLISQESLFEAKMVKELQEFTVVANTHLGVKKMISHVIKPIDKNNIIVIENNPAFPVVQKREFVRVISDILFQITTFEGKIITAYCNNISAGGIAFNCIDEEFNIGDKVKIKFFEKDFDKDIECMAQIIKSHYGIYIAKYINLNMTDEGKIVKFVFNTITKK